MLTYGINFKMCKQRLISIIVPVFNAENFLARSVESVLSQDYEKFELLLINDGSIDDSENICHEFATRNNKIKLISQTNKGPAAARNLGVKHAAGELVFFLDADDFLAKNALKKLVELYEQSNADMVLSNFNKLTDKCRIVEQKISFDLDNHYYDGEKENLDQEAIKKFVRHFLKFPSNHLVSYCWARLYKLSIIKENSITANENMRLFEDFVFNLAYFKQCKNIVFINQPLYTYVMHDDYVSASMAIINADSLLHDMQIFKKCTEDFFKYDKDINISKEIGHALVHYLIIFWVRSCRLTNKNNKKHIKREIFKFASSSFYNEIVAHYKPIRGNSRLIPLLAKVKLIELLMLACKHKAYKRYGKLKRNVKNV